MSDIEKYGGEIVKRQQLGNAVYDTAINIDSYNALLTFGNEMVKTGLLPNSVRSGAQAVAIILTGKELGLPPMQAIRSIQIIQGKPTLSAELQLALFKQSGGHASWKESDNVKAVLLLTHPNGDVHEETFTIKDAQTAGLVKSGSPWTKYPKAMLRARAISAGIRAAAPDIGMGIYDPEELTTIEQPRQIEQPAQDTEAQGAEIEVIEQPDPPNAAKSKEHLDKFKRLIGECKTASSLNQVSKSMVEKQSEMTDDHFHQLIEVGKTKKTEIAEADNG